MTILLSSKRMSKASLVIVATTLFFGTATCPLKAETNSIEKELAAVKTQFVPDAILSRDELIDVIALARDCGLSEVAEITTYYIHPSSKCGIHVKSRETVHGRNVSFTNVLMDYEKFSSKDRRESSRMLKVKGKFWVNQGCVMPEIQTTFAVRGNTIRVQLQEGLSLSRADQIVAALVSGKVRYATKQLKKDVEKERVDLSKPISVSLLNDGKAFGASFSLGEFAWMSLTFNFDGKIVTVTDVSIMVT